MFKAMKSLRRRWAEVTAIEYALMVSLVAAFIVTLVQTLEMHAKTEFGPQATLANTSPEQLFPRRASEVERGRQTALRLPG
jgi:Flp pilus assembly pilin Flp